MRQRAKRAIATQEELEKFEFYVFEMDDVLEPFVAEAKAARYNFDYSLDSLEDLERYLARAPVGADRSLYLNRAARYLGEVFRNVVGGHWELCLTPPNNAYFKLPIITGYSDSGIEFCPIIMVQGYAFSPEPGKLKRVVKYHLQHRK
jgi:hypothetical protein